MAKAFIQLYSKNFSLFGDRIEIDTEIVPRVGELIDAWEHLKLSKDEVGDFMVMSVIYKLTSKGFAAYITAHQWHKGLRFELLQERGWLMPDKNTELSYDEDDPARSEFIEPSKAKRKK
jgi:hypothetical protein